jgi:hypothetical protein
MVTFVTAALRISDTTICISACERIIVELECNDVSMYEE